MVLFLLPLKKGWQVHHLNWSIMEKYLSMKNQNLLGVLSSNEFVSLFTSKKS